MALNSGAPGAAPLASESMAAECPPTPHSGKQGQHKTLHGVMLTLELRPASFAGLIKTSQNPCGGLSTISSVRYLAGTNSDPKRRTCDNI